MYLWGLGFFLVVLTGGWLGTADAGTRRYCMDFAVTTEHGKQRRHCVKFGVRQESVRETKAGHAYLARQPKALPSAGSAAAPSALSSSTRKVDVVGAIFWRRGVVRRVIDGDTLELVSGERVRLLDINTPELSHHGMPEDPLAQAARWRTAQLAQGQKIWLRLGRKTYDDYGRLLAHVLLLQTVNGKPLWLNGTLVREGYAVVYTFADSRQSLGVYPAELMPYEKEARQRKRGIWQPLPVLDNWRVRAAESCCSAADMGRFRLVRGTVRQVARVGDRFFLNFGPETQQDWRTDFTVEIAKSDASRYFRNVDLVDTYQGKTLEVRGMLKPVDGTMMRVTHPEQIAVVK